MTKSESCLDCICLRCGNVDCMSSGCFGVPFDAMDVPRESCFHSSCEHFELDEDKFIFR